MILICTASSGNNLALAHTISDKANELNLTNQVIDLASINLPLYTTQREAEGMPKELTALKIQFSHAKAFFFCAPEYNGSMPPVLNNAIAWLSVSGKDFRSLFNGKPVGLATHSGGGGASLLLAMRMQFSLLGSNVIGRQILVTSKKTLNISSVESILEQLDRLSI